MQNCLACPYDQHHNHCQDVLTHLCPVEYELRDLIGMRAKGEKKVLSEVAFGKLGILAPLAEQYHQIKTLSPL